MKSQSTTRKPLGCMIGVLRYLFGFLVGWLIIKIKARGNEQRM
jgi:hypothetical protein